MFSPPHTFSFLHIFFLHSKVGMIHKRQVAQHKRKLEETLVYKKKKITRKFKDKKRKKPITTFSRHQHTIKLARMYQRHKKTYKLSHDQQKYPMA